MSDRSMNKIVRKENTYHQEFIWSDHVCSWKYSWEPKGIANLNMVGCEKWVSLTAVEVPHGGRGSKKVMLELNRDQMIALRDFINSSLNMERK